MKPSNPDAGLPTADDVRGIIPRSTLAQDATALADIADEIEQSDGLMLTGGPRQLGIKRSAMTIAALRATSQTPDAVREALEAIVKMDDDAAAAHGKPHANLNGYGLVDLFDCVNHPFGSGEHKQQPYRSNQLEAALSDARAALQQLPATDGPFTQCEKCWQPATCKKYGCSELDGPAK